MSAQTMQMMTFTQIIAILTPWELHLKQFETVGIVLRLVSTHIYNRFFIVTPQNEEHFIKSILNCIV